MSERFLVRAPNWVGDAVMSLPFFASLRKNAGPDAMIACLCRPSLASLFHHVPEITEVIELDQTHGPNGLRFVRLNAQRLRQQQLDTAFCLPSSFGSALMLRLAQIPRRYGHAAEGRRLLLSRTLPYGQNGRRPHRAEGFLNLLRLRWDNPILSRELHFSPGPDVSQRVDALIGTTTAPPVLAMAPGAAQPNKMWMQSHFAAVATRWIDEFRGSVILIGAETDRPRCDELLRLVARDRILNLAGSGDLSVAAEIIRRVHVFLGNDSGLAHLAAAVGTRVVVISGPGDPTEVAPFTLLAVTVRHEVFCSPCYKNDCWRKDKPLECLTEIGADDVWRHVAAQAQMSVARP